MQEYFCFTFDLSAQEAARISGDDRMLNGSRMISPCINVLPMGFSWSFFVVQQIHQQSVLRSLSISEEALFLDNRPAPWLSEDLVTSMPYCDNFHCMSVNQQSCDDAKNDAVNDLSCLGFSIHEDEQALTSFFTLGGEIDGEAGQVRMTSARAWDLMRAFEHAATHVVSPEVMQRLLGHAMFFSTLHRGGMSVFRSCYDFIEKGGPRVSLIAVKDKNASFSLVAFLYCLQASDDLGVNSSSARMRPQGYGVCEREIGSSAVSDLSRSNERWRYRRLPPEEWAPRRRALGRDISTVLGTEDPFPELCT